MRPPSHFIVGVSIILETKFHLIVLFRDACSKSETKP